MSEARISEIKQALHAVYSGSGSDHREADRWLQQFQKSSEAWQAADTLLMSPDAELRETFFGAMTIHTKIRLDFHELPEASIPSLKISLTSHLSRWGCSSEPRPAVVTRLCLALAALAVQTSWNSVVQDLSSAIMQSALPEQQNRAARAVLELMKVLPEECNNKTIVVSDERREDFRSNLCTSVPLLFQFLTEIASGSVGQDIIVQETIFYCLQSWVRYTDIKPVELANFPIFQASFDALRVPDLFEASVDFLIEVLRTYCRPKDSMEIVSIMVPRAMSFEQAYLLSLKEEDEDTARGLCRLFTEMGESYLDILVSAEDFGQLALVKMLMRCTAHPYQEIAVIPLHFWYQFCNALEHLHPKDMRDKIVSLYSSSLEELVGVLVKLMQYPSDLDQFSEDQVESYKGHRYNVADVINDICGVLGNPHVLKLIVAMLEEQLSILIASNQNSSWHMTEACLFAARSISTGVPPNEKDGVPRLLLILPLLPPGNHRLRYTANLVVGRYSHWLKMNPETLGTMFQYLMSGFQHPDCTAAAAIAIKQVCQSCASLMGEPALSLYDHLQLAKPHIQFKDELEILEGLCSIAGILPQQTALAALHKMALPIAHGLTTPSSLRSALQDLDRLCVILQGAPSFLGPDGRHPSVSLLAGVWVPIGGLIRQWPESVDLAEKICRCHKHTLRTAGAQLAEPLVVPLAERITQAFQTAPHHSPYLYCTNVFAGMFGEKTEYAHILTKLLIELSQVVFRMMSSGLPQMIEHPDVVEEYFYMLARYILACPQLIVDTPLLNNAIKLAVAGMPLQHREAHRGLMHFISELVGLGSRGRGSNDFRQPVMATINMQGEMIVRNLLEPIINHDLVRSEDDQSEDSAPPETGVSSLLWRFHRLCPEYLRPWLICALGGEAAVKSSPVYGTFLESICAENATRESLSQALRRFSRACRRNSQRWAR